MSNEDRGHSPADGPAKVFGRERPKPIHSMNLGPLDGPLRPHEMYVAETIDPYIDELEAAFRDAIAHSKRLYSDGVELAKGRDEALARAEKAEEQLRKLQESYDFVHEGRGRQRERAEQAERERDAMHAAAEELRAQGAELGENQWRCPDGGIATVRRCGIGNVEFDGPMPGTGFSYPICGDKLGEVLYGEGLHDFACAYHLKHYTLLPDECREQGKPPRKMRDDEVRLPNGWPGKLHGDRDTANGLWNVWVSSNGVDCWLQPNSRLKRHQHSPFNDPAQYARGLAWWIKNAPADLCLTDDGRSVRPMETNEVRDVVTGKGMPMNIMRASSGSMVFIECPEGDCWVWPESGPPDPRHPCSLPSNRLRVEAFLKGQTDESNGGGCGERAVRASVEAGQDAGGSSAANDTASQANTRAETAAPEVAVLPEAHSGSPSGAAQQEAIRALISECWTEAVTLRLPSHGIIPNITENPEYAPVLASVLSGFVVARMAGYGGNGPGLFPAPFDCNGTGRKTEESDGRTEADTSGHDGRDGEAVRPTGDDAQDERMDSGAHNNVAVPAKSGREDALKPPCIPSHIADTDWTVIEGRAVWRDSDSVRIERPGIAPVGVYEGWTTQQKACIRDGDVPQSLFLAARRWMGWEQQDSSMPTAESVAPRSAADVDAAEGSAPSADGGTIGLPVNSALPIAPSPADGLAELRARVERLIAAIALAADFSEARNRCDRMRATGPNQESKP